MDKSILGFGGGVMSAMAGKYGITKMGDRHRCFIAVRFKAKYGGICGSCTERIYPGDDVRYVEDDLVHVDCEVAAPVERKTETCTECWLIKPCECEVAS